MSVPDLNIRRYMDADLDAVIALFTAAVHQGAAHHYSKAQRFAWAPVPPDRAAWQQRLEDCQVMLAEDDQGLAGFVGYRDTGHIVFLFTAPDRMRRGVAQALYRPVEMALAQCGVPRLFTEASRLARPFFERQGYALDAEETAIRNGVALPRFRMHKQLPPRR